MDKIQLIKLSAFVGFYCILDSYNPVFTLKKCFYFQVNYTHVLDFEHLTEEMERMLPRNKQKTLRNLNIRDVRLNVNSDNVRSIRIPKTTPVTNKPMTLRESLKSLKPQIYKRLCQLYEKDFIVFGYKYPDFEEISSANFLP